MQIIEGEHTDDEESEIPSLPKDIVDAQGDEGEFVSCILEKVLLAPHLNNQTQRHSIFRIRCTVNNKVRELVIDHGCTENIISMKVIKALQLNLRRIQACTRSIG